MLDSQFVSLFLTYLALVDPRVPGHDVLDLENPVVARLVLDQLEPVVGREGHLSVGQNVPVFAAYPRKLKQKINKCLKTNVTTRSLGEALSLVKVTFPWVKIFQSLWRTQES